MNLHTYTTPAGATVEARDREEARAKAGGEPVKYSHTTTTAPLPANLRGLEGLMKAIEGVRK